MARMRTERSRRIIWIADWCAVTGFLEREPYLRRLVDSAYQKISDYFLSPRITVAMVDNPVVAGGPCLVLAVGIPGDQGDAAQRLDLFVREWLGDALLRTRGKLRMVLLPCTTTQPIFDNSLIAGVQRAQDLGYTLAATPEAHCNARELASAGTVADPGRPPALVPW